ncbi:hypothetical protein SEUCBS140593_007119 [Sporothrix eucalyptigena]|uniref:Cyanovirin-N domain-containing protein n=1 Tax=Sporothrix eucalyptigena TaxID=1812306 RepID=A0ABP0CAI4_9PEZI
MPSSSSLSTISLLRQTVTKAVVTIAVSLATVPQPAAGQLAFAGSCNIQTAQLEGSHLGMYCNNLNTASFGYNWTCGYNRIPTSSTLDLNTVLVDVDGAMGCYGRLGNKTLRGPLPKH